MRKYLLMVLILLFAAFFFMRNQDKPVLRIGMECDYAPNNWEEKEPSNSNLPITNHEGFYAEGYDLQIAKVIADKLGYKLEVKKYDWNKLIAALNNKEIDAVFSGMFDTADRRKRAAFSETYEVEKTIYGVIVNVNSKYRNSRTLNEFIGAKFTAQKNTELEAAINLIPGAVHAEPVETVREMLDELTSGRVDATVINLDTGRSYERRFKNLKLIELPKGKGFTFHFKGVCAAVRKDDTELLKDINKILSRLSKKERQKIMDNVIQRLWASS